MEATALLYTKGSDYTRCTKGVGQDRTIPISHVYRRWRVAREAKGEA
jgi:hypothetical protein